MPTQEIKYNEIVTERGELARSERKKPKCCRLSQATASKRGLCHRTSCDRTIIRAPMRGVVKTTLASTTNRRHDPRW